MPISPTQHQVIRSLIQSCGQQVRELTAQSFQIFEKEKNDFVTSVDQQLDRYLSTEIAALYPEDGIITEENAQSRQAFFQEYRRLWLIDPIDGTDDFIKGSPHYVVMIGLLEAGQAIAGWVYAPASDHLYYGGAGWGLFQEQGLQSAISSVPEPFLAIEPPPPTQEFCPLLMGEKDQRKYGAAIARHLPGATFSSIGSFGLKVIQIIQGHAGLYLYLNRRVKLWDTTGPLALANAAGLVCCDLEGQPLRFTADAIDPATLIHNQPIIIGWQHYIDELRPYLKQAVEQVLKG